MLSEYRYGNTAWKGLGFEWIWVNVEGEYDKPMLYNAIELMARRYKAFLKLRAPNSETGRRFFIERK